MAVIAINLVIPQGEDFSATFNIKNPDESIPSLASYTILGTLKKYPGSSVGYPFTTSLTVSTGTVVISLTRTITASLAPGRYYYDIFLVSPGGTRTKVIDGNVMVEASATLPT